LDFDLTIIKFLIFLGFLSFASIQDVRSRYVSDVIWVIAGIVIALILFFEIIIGKFDLLATILSLVFAVGISYPLSRTGFLGEADVFALILLALYMPTLAGKELFSLPVLAGIANASILSLSEMCANLSRNASMLLKSKDIFDGFEDEPKHRKILAMFLGHRSDTVRRLSLSMETTENGRRRFNFSAWRSSSDFAKGNDIWITPALPFIVYITIGYAFLFFVGDLLHIFRSFLF
jgi:preflagellin peptidase FlaK